MITDKIDAITNIPESHRNGIIPAPKSVKMELTGSCDFKCFFCATTKNLRKKAHMDLALFKQLAAEMREDGVEELGLFYLGESFLYPHLVEAIRFAKDECQYPYVFLTTNGRLASPDKVESCMRAGLDSLKFSYNWADREQCIEITAVDAFERVTGNIMAARVVRDRVEAETGHRCGIYASSIKYNGEQQAKMQNSAAIIAKYVDEHYWLPLFSQHSLITADADEHGYVPIGGNPGREDKQVAVIPCWALFTEGHVTWDGMLSACCFSHTDEFTMGDLKKQTFMDAWNSPKFQKLRNRHLCNEVRGTICENCFVWKKK